MNELLKESAAAYLHCLPIDTIFFWGKRAGNMRLLWRFPRGVLAFGRASQDKGRSVQNKKTCA